MSHKRGIKSIVLRESYGIQQYVDFTTLRPALVNPDLQFMRISELRRIQELQTDTEKANHLLITLAKKPSSAVRKFLACLWAAREHRGHEDLLCAIWPKLSEPERDFLVKLCKNGPESGVSPVRPPAFVELQGDLANEKFLKVEKRMWDHFGVGEYDKLAGITRKLVVSPSAEWKIVGSWFQAQNCVFIHQCKDHQYCINHLLKPSLQECRSPSVANQNILEGRIHLRMAQVYLTTGQKAEAVTHSERARQLLSLSRGYDRAVLSLREAKVMSATQPDRKQTVEKLFLDALDNFDELHTPCRPTAHLSLAAFYLHISFGSKPSPVPPPVERDSIRKARAQLDAISGMFLPSIRQCEMDLLSSELTRLDGKLDEAQSAFEKTIAMAREVGLHNIVSIAEHRCQCIAVQKEKEHFLDDLLDSIESGLS